MAQIQDFGEKIGGARKDLWKSRGLALSDLEYFNDAERDKYITKNNIWVKPEYEAMVEQGYDKSALFYIKNVRDSIPAKPLYSREDAQDTYVEFVSALRDRLLEIKTPADIDAFGLAWFENNGYLKNQRYSVAFTEKGNVCMNNKLLKAIQMSAVKAKETAIAKDFLYTEAEKIKEFMEIIDMNSPQVTLNDNYHEKFRIEVKNGWSTRYFYLTDETSETAFKEGIKENPFVVVVQNKVLLTAHTREEAMEKIDKLASVYGANKEKDKEVAKEEKKEQTSNRRKNLTPPQLEHIKRTGPTVRTKTIEGQDFLDVFKIKGGEFGNWLNEKDRQANMNLAFESFKDLALALNIPDEDISLGGRLNIAFGARGHGNALAHYEGLREVINLTKMKGAGSLAHEHFHAIDNIFGGGYKKDFLTDLRSYEAKDDSVAKAIVTLVDTMKRRGETIAEQIEKREKNIETSYKEVKKAFDMFIPDRKLTPELIAQKNELFDKMVNAAKGMSSEENFHEWDTHKQKWNLSDNPLNQEFKDFFVKHGESVYTGSTAYITKNCTFLASKLDCYKSANLALNEPFSPSKTNTKFYSDALIIDNKFSKSGHDYWQSDKEMAARAFACYIKDKLEGLGIQNDYLVGHAEFPPIVDGDRTIYTYPVGEERKAINEAFDKFFDELKEIGLLHERPEEVIVNETQKQVDEPIKDFEQMSLFEQISCAKTEQDGQSYTGKVASRECFEF